MTVQENKQWQAVCSIDDLIPDSGVAAKIDNRQIALFYLPENDSVYALDNYCPFSCANVISRGIVGDLKGKTVVASPIYKQHFCLESGVCLEDESVSVSVFDAKIVDGQISVSI